jgi:hypothetical protein
MRLPHKRRDRLQIAIVINQLATPGLGSWIAGHRVAGAGQLAFSISGFLYFLVRCVEMVGTSIRTALDGGIAPGFPMEAWNRALLLIGIAWLWAGITSLQLFRELRNLPAPPPTLPTPPTLR